MNNPRLWVRRRLRLARGWSVDTYKLVRAQPVRVQALSGPLAVVLLAGLVTLGGEALTSEGVDVAAGDRRTGGDPRGALDGDTEGGPGTTEGPAGSAPGTAPGSRGRGSSGGGGGSGGTGPGGFPDIGGPIIGPGGEIGTACGDGGAPPSSTNRTSGDRGVSATHVKVVFPVFDPAAAFKLTGASTSIETAEEMINACLAHVNANGGIDGRLIDPIVQTFNPLNETSMRAQCIKWTQDDRAFAVVDSDAWHSDAQLCLTEEFDTPLISRWTTTNEWTRRGAPYLWWNTPSADETIANWALWALEAGHLGGANVVGVAISDRPSDRGAKTLIEQALAQVGVSNPLVEVISFDNSQAQTELPGAIQRMKARGVNKLFMMLPFTTYSFWLNHAGQQNFYPRYLLSDYEATLVVTGSLLAANNPRALHQAVGPTHIHAGEVDRLENFRPAPLRCSQVFMAGNPTHPEGKIEIAGVAMRWCENITVFVQAARAASRAHGGRLTRANFTEAMAALQGVPGRMTPSLRFGPGDYSGPEQAKVVEVRVAEKSGPPGQETIVRPSGCPPELDDVNPDDRDDICFVELEPFRPLRRL